MRRATIGGPLLVGLALLASSPTASAAFAERACGSRGFLCSTVTAPLEASGAIAGSVRLAVRRLPAATTPTPAAFVVVLGGPGQAGTPLADELADAVGAVRGPRDLVVYDERGSGRSGPLRCRTTSVRGCARELGRRRGAYTTAADVADLEAIRAAGGYERLTLYATSYGTKVALQYAAAHPDRVERLVLDSIVTPEGPDPLQLPLYARVRQVLPGLCADGACRRPLRALAKLVRQLRHHPLRTAVVRASGRDVRVRVTAADLVSILLAGDRNPIIRAETPSAILAAVRGDGAALARLEARVRGLRGAARAARGSGVNAVRNVTTICEELPFPWRRQAGPARRSREARAAVRALPARVLAPFDATTVLRASLVPLCLRWPVASPAPPADVPLPTGIPALLLAGEQDLRTPLQDARSIAARLGPAAELVAVPHVGHSVLGSDASGCADAALAAFMSDRPVAPCARSEPLVQTPRVPPRSIAAVAPYRGVPGLAGRTLAATSRTVADAVRATTSARLEGTGRRVGGLRGGVAIRTAAGVRLRRYSYVPGVELSGTVPREAGRPLRMTVSGRSAAIGAFTVADGRISGRLGGVRIAVGVHAPAARAAAAPLAAPAAMLPPHPRLARIP
ncbi:MAG TPA: alpha/beta fold hydrolase [Capillimicrobium sp.]|nr:alpha/beta fold hydrolase [Capillimicrobium sp.]